MTTTDEITGPAVSESVVWILQEVCDFLGLKVEEAQVTEDERFVTWSAKVDGISLRGQFPKVEEQVKYRFFIASALVIGLHPASRSIVYFLEAIRHFSMLKNNERDHPVEVMIRAGLSEVHKNVTRRQFMEAFFTRFHVEENVSLMYREGRGRPRRRV